MKIWLCHLLPLRTVFFVARESALNTCKIHIFSTFTAIIHMLGLWKIIYEEVIANSSAKVFFVSWKVRAGLVFGLFQLTYSDFLAFVLHASWHKIILPCHFLQVLTVAMCSMPVVHEASGYTRLSGEGLCLQHHNFLWTYVYALKMMPANSRWRAPAYERWVEIAIVLIIDVLVLAACEVSWNIPSKLVFVMYYYLLWPASCTGKLLVLATTSRAMLEHAHLS